MIDDTDAVPCNPKPPEVQPDQKEPASLDKRTEEYFDIFMIYQQKYEPKIAKLKEILQKFVALPDGRRLTFCLEDIAIPHIADKYEYFEKSLKQSRYKFIYVPVDADFSSEGCDTDEEGLPYKLKQHYVLNEMIRQKDNSVVPVTDNLNTKLPRLLDIFRGLSVWKLLKQRSLDDVSDVNELSNDDVDMRFVEFIRHMFDPAALPTPREYAPSQLKQLIQANCAILSEWMDPDNGLLIELYSKEVISHRELETIKAGKTSYDRNDALLLIIQRKSDEKCQKFVTTLRTANMSHLAQMLEIKP